MFSFIKEKKSSNNVFQDLKDDLKHESTYYLGMLVNALNNKDADTLEIILHDGFTYKFYTQEFVGVLCDLLLGDWHHSHENIISILQDLKSPESIEYLYKVAEIQFEYLKYDEVFALATKCIWALGDINTPKAHEKLKRLALSTNEVIKSGAIYQLNRLNVNPII